MTDTIDPPPTGSASVHYSTSDGSATEWNDYDGASDDLWFGPSQTTQTFWISTIDDSDQEPTETFYVALSNPSGANLGSPSSAAISILDNDSPPPAATISLSSNGSVTEGGQVLVMLILSQAVDHEVTVHYQTSDGSAT